MTSLSFTEEMTGFFAFGEVDPVAGEQVGRERGQRLMFHLTITVNDVDTFVTRADHRAHARGWVGAGALGGRRDVRDGAFNLFVAGDSAASRRMLYRLYFTDGGGSPLTLSGHKVVRDDPGLDLWADTTTMYVHLLDGYVSRGEEPGARVTGAGVLRIDEAALLRQLATFGTGGPGGPEALARFGRFFLGELWDVYVAHPPDRSST